MRDLKIRPGMDTPKAKLKNPAPKDADSLLKQHIDKRQREKERKATIPCVTPPTAWRKLCAGVHLGRRMPRGV